jgi:hypothetical protein
VLGSDFYDKLLVLRALRPRFPQTIFFTTDLDARLSHPDVWGDTHNLIVASAFGLSLADDYQNSLPPFRDSYQTSVFASTFVALREEKIPDPASAAPRLFEIGRGGPVDISVYGRHPGDGNWLGDPQLHPPRASAFRSTALSLGRRVSLVLLAGATLLLVVARVRLKSGPRRRVPPARFAGLPYVVFLAASVAGVLIICWLYEGDEGEPFALLAGVSIWGTQIVRWVALGLCVHFAVMAGRQLAETDHKLRIKYKLGRKGDRSTETSRLSRWQQALAEWWWSLKDERSKPKGMSEIWARVAKHGQMRNRWARVLPRVAIATGLAVWLTRSLSPAWVPFRGRVSFAVDRIMEYTTLFAVISLVLFIADEAQLCARLIRLMHAARWADHARKHWAALRGVGEQEVDGFLTVQLIARRTEVAARLTLLPFLVVALLALSRLSYFDNWDWPPSLIIVLATLSFYAFAVGLRMRTAAEKARRRSLDRLNDQLAVCREADQRKQLERLEREITKESRGAFSTLAQHPVVATILLPSGGVGIWALLEYFAKLQ